MQTYKFGVQHIGDNWAREVDEITQWMFVEGDAIPSNRGN